MSRLVLRAGGASHVGRQRSINQDSFVLLPDRNLWVVADGMGGHQGGEVASQLAVETLQVSYRDPTAESLLDAIAVANHRIRNSGEADPALQGMGTTVVAAALVPQEAPAGDGDQAGRMQLLIANVGDSRAYLHRAGELTQLTEDHSVVADLVRDGRISAEEAEVHPQRNIVTRVLGIYETVDVDLWPIDPVEGDRYLLCSDGLFNEVGADQISAVLRRLGDPQEVAEELVRLANDGGGRDNITVVVLDVVDDGGVAEAASSALAGAPSGLSSAAREEDADLAGFSTALSEAEAEGLSDEQLQSVLTSAEPSRRERRAARKAARGPRSRFTWRVAAFTVLVLAVIGGAFATIQWYGTSTYYVGFDADDEVAIFRGRPGGLLWIEPALVDATGIERDDVPARAVSRIEDGVEQSSRGDAERFVANLEEQIDDATPTTTTTTSTTSTTTSTTAVP
ncbi:MAG: Stp1/IreP family PP2C-type Ser/Thr phosphatase [Acidimicrobiales bacterium]